MSLFLENRPLINLTLRNNVGNVGQIPEASQTGVKLVMGSFLVLSVRSSASNPFENAHTVRIQDVLLRSFSKMFSADRSSIRKRRSNNPKPLRI